MRKWKKRFEQLRESSMCRNVWAYLQIEPDGQQTIVYKHLCDDDCAFLKAIHGDVHDVVVPTTTEMVGVPATVRIREGEAGY